ncbi:MAG: sulfurtransferase [Candidatus Marinimicrobia bacterium]|nr:sulfurtransferase [Candidatus Neomarinimicrobiota bacterium]
MRKNILKISWLIAFLLIFQMVNAQIISPKELAKIMKNEDVTIISARKNVDYAKVHINGALNVWHMDLYKDIEVKGLLKSTEEIADILGKKGISEKNTIVIYDSGKNTFAGRLYWIFKYLGCEDVKVLNGQMKMWRKARKPVTKAVTDAKPVTFNASLNGYAIATTEYVKSHLEDAAVVLIDVRDKEEFDGQKGNAKRNGHIPGAVHFEYKNVLNEDGTIKSKEELEELLKKACITKDKEVILYCETSVRTGIVYMAMTSLLDYLKVRVYDGAIYEWAADSELPMQ